MHRGRKLKVRSRCKEMEYMCYWANLSNPAHVLIGPWAIGFNGLDILDKWLIDFQIENELMWAPY